MFYRVFVFRAFGLPLHVMKTLIICLALLFTDASDLPTDWEVVEEHRNGFGIDANVLEFSDSQGQYTATFDKKTKHLKIFRDGLNFEVTVSTSQIGWPGASISIDEEMRTSARNHMGIQEIFIQEDYNLVVIQLEYYRFVWLIQEAYLTKWRNFNTRSAFQASHKEGWSLLRESPISPECSSTTNPVEHFQAEISGRPPRSMDCVAVGF